MSADDLQDIEQLDADLWKIADDVLSVGAMTRHLVLRASHRSAR